jgi:5,10-methylenetetrahydrofolate reductase
MPEDQAIRGRITELVERERELRDRMGRGEIDAATEHARLQEIEVELDQCWDLLRQRDAKREFHQDPDTATARSPEVVESYEN